MSGPLAALPRASKQQDYPQKVKGRKQSSGCAALRFPHLPSPPESLAYGNSSELTAQVNRVGGPDDADRRSNY